MAIECIEETEQLKSKLRDILNLVCQALSREPDAKEQNQEVPEKDETKHGE